MAAVIKHNIGVLGAIISFFGFSATIPLLFLLIYGASMFIPHASIQHFLLGVLESFVPAIPDAKLYLAQNVSRLVLVNPRIGVFGMIGLLWSTVGGLVSFQQILDVIWETCHRRSFLRQYLIGFGMLGILLLLTVISPLATSVSPLLIQGVFTKTDEVFWLVMVSWYLSCGVSLVALSDLLFLLPLPAVVSLEEYISSHRGLRVDGGPLLR